MPMSSQDYSSSDGEGEDQIMFNASSQNIEDKKNLSGASCCSNESIQEEDKIIPVYQGTGEDGNDTVEEEGLESQLNSGRINNRLKKMTSIASIANWWKGYVDDKRSKRKKIELTEERRMRYKLQYHFMSPFDKYKLGRKPWKLAIQILKIFIVTTQVILFGTDRFAAIAFIKNTEKTYKYLFIEGYDGSKSFSYYSRTDLASAIRYAHFQYHHVEDIALGHYWHSRFENRTIYPINLCEKRYELAKPNAKASDIDYNADTVTVCEKLTNATNLTNILHTKHYFDRIAALKIKFDLRAIYLNGLKLHHAPECLIMYNSITIDNSKHDGRLRVSFHMTEEIMSKCTKTYKKSKDAATVKATFIAFDALVITICSFSILLCIRSVVKSVVLAKAAQKYFKDYKRETLTRWDLFELINKWFAVIVISDMLSVIGSIYKIYVDDRDIRYYNICALFLGLGVVMVWIGLLRFFTYLKKYNILLITLRSAAPSLVRFMFCAMFMFFGFTFCGWISLGPYHKKFSTFLTTAECLFSLLNGDDMYPTFAKMSTRNTPIWIFSKIYIYTFVSLFIYVVLSTFISIVGDTYERLKDWGHMPPTRIELFMAGKKRENNYRRNAHSDGGCQRCARESHVAEENQYRSLYGSLDRNHRLSLSASQLSIMSASLE